ncbi:hypothetical protein BpHYR1_044863 [Brachionus plicatilis]|uniref:Secreted protein n=1 Tax=Brachionus plicatilis TaxID=10195 RepID=A0A3M7R0Z4_BRAPC|nr:hypothetical protein BpHYR1_044863 [Brachionus plicatilis]
MAIFSLYLILSLILIEKFCCVVFVESKHNLSSAITHEDWLIKFRNKSVNNQRIQIKDQISNASIFIFEIELLNEIE